MDLDKPAVVAWPPFPETGMQGVQNQPFDTLRDALRFVMEEVDRETASRLTVRCEGKTLAFKEISASYHSFFKSD